MKKPRTQETTNAMETDLEEDLKLSETSDDICQTLIDRYSKSTAPQHRHLIASASAMKSILLEESLPLTPPAFFAATISALDDSVTSNSLDANAISALSSFLSILLPLVQSESLPPSKAIDAVQVLVELLRRQKETEETAGASTVRSVIKSIEVLMMFCDLENWGVVELPFETVLGFAFDKRPKVRRCAQVCLEKLFKSFQHSIIIKPSSKLILSSFKYYMPLAIDLSTTKVIDRTQSQMLLKPNHLEVLHMLNLLHLIVPYLSNKVSLKISSELNNLTTSRFSPLTRHIHSILKVLFDSSREVIVPEVENIIVTLESYVSSIEKNPMDTVISALDLLKLGLNKLHGGEPSIWLKNLPLVFGSVAGFLAQSDASSHAVCIIKELINCHIDRTTFLASEDHLHDKTAESNAIESICLLFNNLLSSEVANEEFLEAISDMFLKLGDISYIFMKDILLKLADLVMVANGDMPKTKHLQSCIGSAVVAMGPEKILTLLPISLREELTCSNVWLIPVLKRYIVGSSLEYFMEHILSLVESFRQASKKGKHSDRKDLKTYVRDLLDLLPAFCRYPTDTHKNFEPFAKRLITFLKKDGFMHENIALALKELVNQNRSILGQNHCSNEVQEKSDTPCRKEFSSEPLTKPSHYSRKVASRNIKALESCSVGLLQAFTDVFFSSSSEKRTHLTETIGCLASISETSEVTRIFISLLEKFQTMKGAGESAKMSDDKKVGNMKQEELLQLQKCVMMEFASALVEGANEDLLLIIFDYIKPALMNTDGIDQSRAYYTLSRIFKEHTTFYSSRLNEMMDLLLGLKFPVDSMSLRSRFACFSSLLIYILQSDMEEKNEKSFLILNEIVLTLKDSNEEARATAYDMLLEISRRLKDSSSTGSDSLHQQLCSMIMGYLSGAPPTIMSGAIAALSLLMYTNNDICFSVPELVPSVLLLFQSKAKEIIKAVLGFVKVLVSCLQANDLQKFLPDIVDKILPWSLVSRNHFKSKVIVILEIAIRKCGSSVESLVPKKYERFMKTVMEQRHGKMNSKEPEIPDAVPIVTSPHKRGLKRMHGEYSSQRDRTGSGIRTTHNQDKKRRLNASHTNETHFKGNHSGHAKRKDSNCSRSLGGKAKIEHNKSSKAQFHKSASTSKFQKPKKTPTTKKKAKN